MMIKMIKISTKKFVFTAYQSIGLLHAAKKWINSADLRYHPLWDINSLGDINYFEISTIVIYKLLRDINKFETLTNFTYQPLWYINHIKMSTILRYQPRSDCNKTFCEEKSHLQSAVCRSKTSEGWPLLHCRFSLSLHFARQRAGWVKIYNVKKVKTEKTCAPPKTYQSQKSFWVPSKKPPNTCRVGWANFFIKNMFSWKTLLHLFVSSSLCLFTWILKLPACEDTSIHLVGFLPLWFTNVSSKDLPKRVHGHTDCIRLTFLHCVFLKESLYRLGERTHSRQSQRLH